MNRVYQNKKNEKLIRKFNMAHKTGQGKEQEWHRRF